MIRSRVLPLLVTGMLGSLLLTVERGQAGGKVNKQEVNQLVSKMQARFQAWDVNGDGVLNSQELAWAFRGPNAKPYDYKPPVKPFIVPSTAMALVCLPRPSLATNQTLAYLITANAKAKQPPPPPPPDYSNYPDYKFLVLAGKGGQPRLTQADFTSWAKQYAQQIHNLHEGQREVKEAQAKLQKAKKGAAKTAAQAELQRGQQMVNQASPQVSAVPQAIRQALNLNP